METNEAGSGIIRKRPGDEIINWNYGGGGGKRSGSKPNNANFISSVYNFASKRGSRLGCFDAHHAVTNYRVSQLERNYSLANGNDPLSPFFFFHFDIQ